MAKEYVVRDDLDDSTGAETHKLTLDNRTVVIDLAKANYGTLAELLEPYFKAGAERTAAGSGESETTKARVWLRENGHDINDKGRIPAELMNLYRAAQEV